MRCATIEKRLPLSSITSLAARYMLGRGEYGITYLCAQAAMGAWMVYKSISKWKLWTLMDVGGHVLGGGDGAHAATPQTYSA